MRAAAVVAALLLPLSASAAPPVMESVAIRGRPQSVRVYGRRGAPVAIVASGDGGFIHLGPYVAEFLASQGYFVVGFDSKAYLSSFTMGDKTLNTTDVPADFATLVDYAAQGAGTPPLLLGVSEGAALAVLAVTSDTTKAKVAGVIGLGLPDKAELGWRFRDSIIYLTKGVPNEPLFSTAEVIDTVAPLPLVAIHSTKDEFVSVDDIRRVMSRALEPKQLWLIEAADHRFSGKERELDQKLMDAIAWIKAHRR
jgi:alpha-beta hydrolase superfamily lysophospholipase